MIKIFISFFVFLFIIFNYFNIINIFSVFNNDYTRIGNDKKNDLNYYNLGVYFYNETNYLESILYFEKIEKKDYKIFYNLGNSYYFDSFNYTSDTKTILILEKSLYYFNKSLELRKINTTQSNYDVVFDELQKYKEKRDNNLKNNNKVDLNGNEQDGIKDKEIQNYKINIDDEIKKLNSEENKRVENFINSM